MASAARLSANKFHLVWLANNIEELKTKFPQSFTSLENAVSAVDNFRDVDLFLNFFYEVSDEKIILIISGALGKDILPIIHEASQLDSIFIICHNRTYHEQWTKDWSKIKGLFSQIDDIPEAVAQVVRQYEVIPPKSPPISRRALTPERPRRPSERHRVVTNDDDDDQPRETNPTRHRRHDRKAKPSRTDEDRTSSDPPYVHPTTIDRERLPAPIRKINDNHHDTTHLRDEHSRDSAPLVNSMVRTTTETTDSGQPSTLAFDQLQHTLIDTTEREVRKSLLKNNNIPLATGFNLNTITRLEDTLRQTIAQHSTTKNNDPNALNKLFHELKQVIVDTLMQQQQQQPSLLQDLIKRTVLEALSGQQQSVLGPIATVSGAVARHRKPVAINTSREVKIAADSKLTRTDAAFRQRRDAVVANKRLRDVVQEWSTITSIADLATTIRTSGKNDLECAWLLFCWICQNIQYQVHCNNNAAETVFRTRKGVCRGFVSLYHECCSLLGIECAEISGFAKQAFLKPGEELKQSPHAWNSIILDQHTYLIDPTWGAGGKDHKKELEDFYFLTSPEEFIYTHYCNGYQLLEPEISKQEFLSLPVMNSTYYQLGLTLLSPKQGLNETNQNLFKIVIRTPSHVGLFVQLKVGDTEYPRSLHTLCQRDETQPDIVNCFVAPPLDGLYEISVFANKNGETTYCEAISMRLRVSNIADAFTLPLLFSTFTEHKCILIEPLRRLVDRDEQVLIHMIIPNANVIKIQNGDDHIVPGKDEYKRGVLKKRVRVQGDLQVWGRWDDNADSISVICVFNML